MPRTKRAILPNAAQIAAQLVSAETACDSDAPVPIYPAWHRDVQLMGAAGSQPAPREPKRSARVNALLAALREGDEEIKREVMKIVAENLSVAVESSSAGYGGAPRIRVSLKADGREFDSDSSSI